MMDGLALIAELPRLRRYARALVGDRGLADDLVQDTLERAWAQAHRWQPGTNLRGWLLAIMHNLRVDALRRSRFDADPIDDEAVAAVPTRATQDDRLELAGLAAALEQVPETQRAVLLLVGLEEMTYAEIAATLDVPIGTVMSRLARGRERLRAVLDGDASPARLGVVR